MKPIPLTRILALVSLSIASAARSAVIVTYAESPTATNSSLGGTSVLTFNSMSLERSTNVSWKGVGTFDQLYIKSADNYGGAVDAKNPDGSRYSVQGVGTSVSTSTLKLDKASSYFGMWWSAGDAKNVLDFYSGKTLVAEFTTASLMDPLPAEYDGNPRNRMLDSWEPFAFINFMGDPTTSWDKIVMRNDGSSGFESDNYTSRVAAWNPLVDGALPGVPVSIVSGTKTTKVTAGSLAGSRWAATPGAPAPPWSLLMVLGVVFMFKTRSSNLQLA